MRLAHLCMKGIGPFHDEVELDLSAIPGPIVAVVGETGAGKSTLLEAMALGLYRTTPTRGKFAELATAKDSFVHMHAVNGAAYTFKHTEGSALVLDTNGAPVFADAKKKSFKTWAAKHLPAPEVFFSSTFAAQGSGGFLTMKGGARKAVLLRALGIEHLEKLAEKARKRATAAKHELEVVVARLGDERERRLGVVEAKQNLKTARAKAAEADIALEKARAELARVEEDARKVEAAKASLEAYAEQESKLLASQQASQERITDLGRRIANNRRVLADADRIRGAVEEAAKLRQNLEQLTRSRDAASRDVQEHEQAARQWRERETEAHTRARASRQRIDAAQRRLAGRDVIEDAVRQLERLRDAVGEASQAKLEADEAWEALANQAVAGLGGRVVSLRGGLARIVANRRQDPVEIASIALLNDDKEAKLADELPGLKAAASDRCKTAQAALDKARSKLTTAEQIAYRAPDLDLAQQDLEAAQRDATTADAEAATAKRNMQAAETRACDAGREHARLGHEIRKAESRLAEVEPIASRAKHLDKAEARIDELAPQLDDARRDLNQANADITRLGAPPAVPPMPDVESARFALKQAERAARDAHAAPPVREHALKQALESQARVVELEDQRTDVEGRLANWTKLATDLGRNGLQAMEVDAVGPQLSELTNDLLHTCLGPRWTVSIETQRDSSDGKKTIEECDVKVLDTEAGREASAESLSGGERALVGESVSLALSMLACQRAGIEGVTLVRDETAAPLDAGKARGYVAMLRRAAEIVGAGHVLFVSHSPDVQELADARVLVADGRVEVVA